MKNNKKMLFTSLMVLGLSCQIDGAHERLREEYAITMTPANSEQISILIEQITQASRTGDHTREESLLQLLQHTHGVQYTEVAEERDGYVVANLTALDRQTLAALNQQLLRGAQLDSPEMVASALKAGAEIDYQDPETGDTANHIAYRKHPLSAGIREFSHSKVNGLLLINKANEDIANHAGQTVRALKDTDIGVLVKPVLSLITSTERK